MGAGLAMVVMVGAPGIIRVGMAASMAVRCCRSRLARTYGSASILAAASCAPCFPNTTWKGAWASRMAACGGDGEGTCVPGHDGGRTDGADADGAVSSGPRRRQTMRNTDTAGVTSKIDGQRKAVLGGGQPTGRADWPSQPR